MAVTACPVATHAMTQQTNKVARHKQAVTSQAIEAPIRLLSPDEAVCAIGWGIHPDPTSTSGLGTRSAWFNQLGIQKTMHRIHHATGRAARKATTARAVTDITYP